MPYIGVQKHIEIDGVKVKVGGTRLACFKRSLRCCKCGIEGAFFVMERTTLEEQPHLNLYAVKDGASVLMTKDHIFPKSKGGSNRMHNLITMCCNCNRKKADTID